MHNEAERSTNQWPSLLLIFPGLLGVCHFLILKTMPLIYKLSIIKVKINAIVEKKIQTEAFTLSHVLVNQN